MADFRSDAPLKIARQQLTAEQFARAWFLRARTVGELHGNGFFTALFAVLGAAFLALRIPDLAQFRWESAIVGLLEFLFCAAAVIYHQMVLPARVQSAAAQRFHTNRVLQLPETLTLTRDGFRIENACERFAGSWAETDFCAEDDACWVIGGFAARDTLIVLKQGWTSDEIAAFSARMQENFAGRYRRRGARKEARR